MASERTAPDFQVFDSGQPISKTVRAAVIQITVDERLNQAALCTIELRDDGGALSDGSKFKLGSEVRVALGYMGATKVIFEGEVTGWKGAFPRRGPRTLTVVAHDRFHRLRREKKQRNFTQMKDSEIAQKIAGEYGFSCDVKTSLVKHDYVIQANEPDADFLLERARASGFELFVEGKKLVFRAPKVDGAAAVKLKWHENLKRFAPTISIARTPTQVTATSYDMKQKKLVTVTAKKGDEGASMGGSKTGADLAGVVGEMTHHIPWMPLMAPEEMQALAKGMFALSALRLVTGEGEAQGNVEIRRGALIDVDAIGDFLSGSYYVETALHTLLPGYGYTTTFRVKRLAVAKPPAPPPAQAPAQGSKSPAPEPGSGKVEFVLTNQFGEPVEGLDYVLTCPDGEKKTGKVPANGIVTEPNAKPGMYKLALKGVDPPLIAHVDEEGAAKKASAGGTSSATALKPGEGALEVQLLNKVGRPQANVFWEVTLPDGTQKTGKSDAEGWIRIPMGSVKGECKLRLPELEDGAANEKESVAGSSTKDESLHKIQLHDGAAYDPIANVPVEITLPSGEVLKATTDANGWAEVKIPEGTKKLSLAYTPAGGTKIERDVYLTDAAPDSDEALATHLKNMGFHREGEDDQLAVIRFQGAHPDLKITGELDQATKDAIQGVVEGDSMKDKL